MGNKRNEILGLGFPGRVTHMPMPVELCVLQQIPEILAEDAADVQPGSRHVVQEECPNQSREIVTILTPVQNQVDNLGLVALKKVCQL